MFPLSPFNMIAFSVNGTLCGLTFLLTRLESHNCKNCSLFKIFSPVKKFYAFIPEKRSCIDTVKNLGKDLLVSQPRLHTFSHTSELLASARWNHGGYQTLNCQGWCYPLCFSPCLTSPATPTLAHSLNTHKVIIKTFLGFWVGLKKKKLFFLYTPVEKCTRGHNVQCLY